MNETESIGMIFEDKAAEIAKRYAKNIVNTIPFWGFDIYLQCTK